MPFGDALIRVPSEPGDMTHVATQSGMPFVERAGETREAREQLQGGDESTVAKHIRGVR